MKRILSIIFSLGSAFWVGAAVPTFESLEPTQFETNGFRVAYKAVHTNDAGIIYPALTNLLTLVTNENVYGTFSLPAKVTLLVLGTNYLDLSTNSTWLLNSPTNDPTQVILSLSAGAYQGQLLFITSQNGSNSFILPDQSEQWDVPGAYVDIQGDWIGTTNRGIILQYTAPDWIEMARFDPAQTGGGSVFGSGTVPFMPYWSSPTTLSDSPLQRTSATSIELSSATGNPDFYVSRILSTNHTYVDLFPQSTQVTLTVGSLIGGTNNSVGLYSAENKSIVTYQRGALNSFDAADVGSPEGILTARIGSTYRNFSGGSGTTFYVKESGDLTDTGWVAYGPVGSTNAIINPTDGFVPYRIDASSFGDSSLQRLSATEMGSFTSGKTNYLLTTGGKGVFKGTVYSGTNSSAAYSSTDYAFASLHDTTKGEDNFVTTIIEARDTGSTHGSYINSYVKDDPTNPENNINTASTAGGTSSSWTLRSGHQTGHSFFSMDVRSIPVIRFSPDVGATTTAFNLSTAATHTDGIMFGLQNNTTNKFLVNALGAVTVGSVTKAQKTAMTPADGMIVYQTDNTPGFRGYVNGTWFIFSMAADP